MSHQNPVVIVGAGLAGLTAATRLAQAAVPCVLLEAAPDPGGRARSQQRAGATLNLGAHALYRDGEAFAILTGLGVPPSGEPPPTRGLWTASGGQLHRLPTGLWSLLNTSQLRGLERLELARLLAGLARIDADALRGNAAAWVDACCRRPGPRALLRALLRLASYVDAERLAARDAVRQLQRAVGGGVLYLHAGWQSLVAGLRERFLAAGGELRCGSRVRGLRRGPDGAFCLQLAGGEQPARAVILAAGRTTARKLLAPGWEISWPEAQPAFASCLDLVLERLPRPEHRFVLGVDAPLYLSLHSATARLAEPGLHVLHAMRYGPPDPDAREELEAFVERCHPGWRDCLRVARFLPRMLVAEDVPGAGLQARMGVAPLDREAIFLAGDWVGPEGMLADAAVASGAAAAEQILSRQVVEAAR